MTSIFKAINNRELMNNLQYVNDFTIKETKQYPFGYAIYIAPPKTMYEFTFKVGESMNEGILCFPFDSKVYRIPIKNTIDIIRGNGKKYTGYIAADDSFIIFPVDTAPTYRKE